MITPDSPGRLVLMAIITIVTTAGVTYITTMERKVDPLVKEVAESREALGKCGSKLEACLADVASKLKELNGLHRRYRMLQVDYQKLQLEYEELAKPTDVTHVSSLFDRGETSLNVRNGHRIRFMLTDSSVELVVDKITDDGPLVRLEDCDEPHVRNGRLVDSCAPHCYRLGMTEGLKLRISGDCCRRGLIACSDADLEEISIECVEFNAETRTAQIRYQRTFLRNDL